MTACELDFIEDCRRRLEAAKAEKKIREASGKKVHPRTLDIIERSQSGLNSYTKKKNIVESMPRQLGKVLVSSGKAVVDRKIGDWAFVGLNGEAFNNDTSRHINCMPGIPLSEHPVKFGLGYNTADEGTVLKQFGTIEEGRWYCKVGRTTGLTAGVCSGLYAYCQWAAEDRVWFDERGQEVETRKGITEEWVILAEVEGVNGRVQEAFYRRGDSGSGIIDNLATSVGFFSALPMR